MNKNKIVINHLSRTGKLFLFHLLNSKNFQLLAIFTPFSAQEVVAFIKNDSNHGKFWGEEITIQESVNNTKLKFRFADQPDYEIMLLKNKVLSDSKSMKNLGADILVNFDDSVQNKKLRDWTKLVKRFVISGVNIGNRVRNKNLEAIIYGVNHTKILKEKSKLIFINPIETTILVNLIKKISKKIKVNTCYFQIIAGPSEKSKFLDSLQKERYNEYLARAVINNVVPDPVNMYLETFRTALNQQRYTIIVEGEKFVVPVTTGAHLSVIFGMANIHAAEEIQNLIDEVSDSFIAYTKEALTGQDIVSTNHFAVIDGTLVKLLNSRSNKMLKMGLWYDSESSQAIAFLKTLEFLAN